jgi:ELWxxDGT repeat protein
MGKKIFTLLMLSFVINVLQAQELVLPKGMEKLTPDGVEASSFVAYVNAYAPNGDEPKTGDIYFNGKDVTYGNELWISEKTKETTRMLKDINPGDASSSPSGLVMMNSKVYFTAEDGVHGRELWVSDGTEAGTKMVKDIYPGSVSGGPGSMVVLGDKLLFTAMDEESEFLPVLDPTKPEHWIWISDGTEEGTVRVADVPMNGYFEVVGDKAFFAGVDLTNYDALWVTDGTKAGTKMLKNINNKPATSGIYATEPAGIGALRNVNDKWIVFRAETVKEQVGGTKDYGSEIWYSDGTEAGTKWLGFDFAKGEASGMPLATELAELRAVGDTLFFRANDGVHGVEPCIWDFTQPIEDGKNPRLIFDVNHWSGSLSLPSWPSAYNIYQGYLLMQANGGYFMPEDPAQYASGYSLWLSPVNKMDTAIYQRQFWGTDIAPGSLQDGCSRFTPVRDKLFFTAQDENSNVELWKLDNINTSPVKVVDFPGNGSPYSLTNIDGNLYFMSTSEASSTAYRALFKYDLDKATGIDRIQVREREVTISVQAGKLYIDTDYPIASVRLYDLSGKLVKVSGGLNNQLDVYSLRGFYIAKIQFADNESFARKIMLR